MVQILNNIKSWWIVRRLKSLETRLQFNKDFLPIKIEDLTNKKNKKIELLELKKNNDLFKHEIVLGIKSEFLNKEFETEKTKLEEKYYWKTREIIQTLKRQQLDDKSKLESVEKELREEINSLESKYFKPKTSIENEKEHKDSIKRIEENYNEVLAKINDTFETKTTSFNSKLSKRISILEEKVSVYKEILLKTDSNKKLIQLEENEILRLDNLSMHFGGLKAVDQLSFSVKEGEIFGLIGPNGAGKTTVFNCITRFYKPTSGEMYFRNKFNEVADLNEIVVHNIIKHGIIRTFQNVEMIWELNVIENLLVAAHTEYRSGFFGHLLNSRLLRQEEKVMRLKAMKILNDLELTQYAYYYPLGLPYGILKKIELARTLMINPKLIILDEPAAGLNDTETVGLAKTIKKIRDEYKATIFLVEHDMGLVMDICDTVCAISFGKKLAIGTPKEIQNSKVVQDAYLGGE